MNFLTILLLQADTALKPATAAALPAAPEKISLLHLLGEGGALMIPLLFCSVLLVYVFVERFLAIRKASGVDNSFMALLRDQVKNGNITGATATCRNANTAIARVIEKGVSRIDKPIDYIEKSMENSGRLEVYQLEKNLTVLSTLASIAPIFGFLGTIAGMIILFFNVEHQGFSLTTIAGGIYTKMVTSAAGLIIGLLAYVGYSYLNAQINRIVIKMETASAEFLEYIQDQKQ